MHQQPDLRSPACLSTRHRLIPPTPQIEGHITGFGNPTWRATHEPATSTAPAVAALLAAGATVVCTLRVYALKVVMIDAVSVFSSHCNS